MAEVFARIDTDRMEKAVYVYMQGVTEEQTVAAGKAVKAEIVSLIRERADVNSEGGLADSIYGQPFFDGPNEVDVIVASDLEHALWFEEGTGLHGPRSQYIFPRAGRFMAFRPRGSAATVFAAKVQGYEGRHPFRDGLKAVEARGLTTPF